MMKKQKKSIRYLKVKKRPKYPKNFERDYYRVLRAVVRRLKSATNSNYTYAGIFAAPGR